MSSIKYLIFTSLLICMNANYIKGNYCEDGKYGENCEKYCYCRADTSNNKKCDKHGQCDCINGFKGLHCHKEECQKDDDDRSCEEVCDCNGYPCINGICQCKGRSWGTRCEQKCWCSSDTRGCGSDGSCVCQRWSTGKFCTKYCNCINWRQKYYTCNRRFTCDCKYGYFGKDCEYEFSDISNTTESYDEDTNVLKCIKGFWGDGCKKRCNCDSERIIGCSQENGTCECATPYFGEKCEHDRIELCKCDEKGSKSTICNYDGMCQCKDGHWGQKCQRLGQVYDNIEE